MLERWPVLNPLVTETLPDAGADDYRIGRDLMIPASRDEVVAARMADRKTVLLAGPVPREAGHRLLVRTTSRDSGNFAPSLA